MKAPHNNSNTETSLGAHYCGPDDHILSIDIWNHAGGHTTMISIHDLDTHTLVAMRDMLTKHIIQTRRYEAAKIEADCGADRF